MSYANLFSVYGQGSVPEPKFVPPGAAVPVIRRDEGTVPGSLYNEVFWIVGDCESPCFVKNGRDEVLGFMGGDAENPDSLGAEIELWIENDRFTLKNTCFVFVPAGAAHGKISVRGVTSPIFCTRAWFEAGIPTDEATEPTAAAGAYSYATNVVEKYRRADGSLPNVPQGFLKLLLWLDGARLDGAPYMEAVWFCTPKGLDAEEKPHTHEFGEFLACIGPDPKNPGDLGGEMHFFIGEEGAQEEFVMDKSFLLFLPKALPHCPLYVGALDKPFLHFTGGRPSVKNYVGGPGNQ